MSVTIYGYTNCAAFNLRPEGDDTWFETRAERDAALARLRAASVAAGLSRSASVSGIYPIKRTLRGRDAAERAEEMTASW